MHARSSAALGAALLFSCLAHGQENTAYQTDTTIAVYGNKMEVGELVGVQYTNDGRYLLFATPKGKQYANIWRDEVIQVARLALEPGDSTRNAVSFDFERKASAPFRQDDILDPVGLGRILSSADRLAAQLRSLPDGAALAEILASGASRKPDKGVLKRAVALLNRARDADLRIEGDEGFLSPAARSLIRAGTNEHHRLNRTIIEDFFSPSVDRDVATHYVMDYSSPRVEELLKGRRAEAIIMDADTDLKNISGGRAGGEYAIGPAEVVLCAEQARADLQRGQEPHRGEYYTFFGLGGLEFVPLEENGLGAWMSNASMTVQADRVTGETPDCAKRFAANLTRKTGFILKQDGEIPQHLRDLKTMLVIQRAVEFLADKSVPISPEHLARFALDTEKLPNNPPKVMQIPVGIAANDRAILFSIAGGVELGDDAPPPPATAASASAAEPRETPGFIVTTVNMGGRSLWAIDVTSILAP